MSLGESIRAARESAGLSIAQVSERTRIRGAVVSAIEQDSFELCGGDVYARGHIRSIAAVIGLDPEPLVAEYDAAHAVTAPTATEVFDAETSTTKERRGANWSAVMATALVIAVGLVAFQVFRSDSDGSRGTTTVANPEPTVTAPETTASPDPEETKTQVAQAPDEVVLKVSAFPNAVSWLQVTNSSGAVLFSDNLSQGQSKTFRDDKALKVVVGNAAGVSLVVNGTNVGSPGAAGQVAHLTFTPNDPEGSAG
ncbi:MAG TPA: RodZ domain-containing protein [Actinomycetes bacterium]|nr:RodZ domain-containing protein [Actinomycetes bacterium]